MHTLICGRTGSGKSTLAKELGSELRLAGHVVIAFNPTGEDGYTIKNKFGQCAAEWETASPASFMAEIEERTGRAPLFVLIDEAHEFFPKSGAEHRWLATRGRHRGINLILVTQRAQMMDTSVRTQCEAVYLFQCSLTDAKYLADEFGKEELRDATQQPKGHYIHVSHTGLARGKIFG